MQRPWYGLFFLLLAVPLGGAEKTASSVLVLANGRMGESTALARYYMEKRSIPKPNLILLDAPSGEAVSWNAFLSSIYNPLLGQLIERKWIDGVISKLADPIGRLRSVVTGHGISYMVVCKGIPLKINHDPGRLGKDGVEAARKAFQTNRSSVDAELALLAMPRYPITGWVANPLYGKKSPPSLSLQQIIKVSRLDGPDFAHVRGMVDNALLVEKEGLRGRAYLDAGGLHPRGDLWLKRIKSRILPMGYDLESEDSKRNFEAADRFDAPALYFGWYAHDINGPFLNPGFRFPPGAIAVHIHSTSAATLRDPGKTWCGPFIARGATATLGNVSEPYLEFTHHLDAFFEGLAEGMNLGDAGYYSLPVLSWQAVLIGDPLYRPFKVSLEEQLASLQAGASTIYGQYVYIRKMRMLRAEGHFHRALEWGKRGFRTSPGLAIGLELGKMYFSAGRNKEAVETLGFAAYLSIFSSDDWIPAKEIADLLAENGEAKTALGIYRHLIDSPGLPAPLLTFLMRDGAELAHRNGDAALSRRWNSLLTRP